MPDHHRRQSDDWSVIRFGNPDGAVIEELVAARMIFMASQQASAELASLGMDINNSVSPSSAFLRLGLGSVGGLADRV